MNHLRGRCTTYNPQQQSKSDTDKFELNETQRGRGSAALKIWPENEWYKPLLFVFIFLCYVSRYNLLSSSRVLALHSEDVVWQQRPECVSSGTTERKELKKKKKSVGRDRGSSWISCFSWKMKNKARAPVSELFVLALSYCAQFCMDVQQNLWFTVNCNSVTSPCSSVPPGWDCGSFHSPKMYIVVNCRLKMCFSCLHPTVCTLDQAPAEPNADNALYLLYGALLICTVLYRIQLLITAGPAMSHEMWQHHVIGNHTRSVHHFK